MHLELPPRGTYGPEIPRALRPLLRAGSGLATLMFRLGLKVQGRPLLRLTTVGARTGKTRHAVLGWFPDHNRPDSWLVVASNGGSSRHPGWAHNLARRPDRLEVDVGEGPVDAEAEILTGAERQEVWKRVVEMAPGYGAYTNKTDRELPIFEIGRAHV